MMSRVSCNETKQKKIVMVIITTYAALNPRENTRPGIDWLINKKKKKRIYYQVDFAGQPDHKIKMKENENIDKYLDLAGERKKCRTWEWP